MSVFNASLVNMIEQNLYTLKRQYGGPIVLCSLLDAVTDYTTGSKVVQYRTYQIAKAIVLPSRMTREVVASVARISSNKPLAYGGEFNVGDRGFIIQGSDVPSDWEVKKDDWIVYRGDRYSLKTVLNVCGNTGWMIVARKHPGTPIVFELVANTAITLDDGASV
jgi:hypothetical protein